jgi:hypothetical protein
VHLKKLLGFPEVSRNPSSPAAREPISKVIPFDLLKKTGALMQKANVSIGEKRTVER